MILGISEQDCPSGLIFQDWEDQPTFDWGMEWIAPYHRHLRCPEVWFVQSGTLEFLVDGERVLVSAGRSILVEPGEAHTFRNPGPGATRYRIGMTSETLKLIDALHGGVTASIAFAEHGAVLVDLPSLAS